MVLRIFGLLVLMLFLLSVHVQAAIPPQNQIVGKGKVFGGEAGSGFSLLKVSQSKTKKGERWVLSIGNEQGRANKGRPGYYHVEMNSALKFLSIDLSQLRMTKVNEKKLQAIIAKSNFLKNPKMKNDPLDQSLNLAFELKKNPKVKVYQVAGVKGTSRVVVDLFE